MRKLARKVVGFMRGTPVWEGGTPVWEGGDPRFVTFCLVGAQTEAKSKENAYLDCVSRHVFGVWPKSGLISGEIGWEIEISALSTLQLTRSCLFG